MDENMKNKRENLVRLIAIGDELLSSDRLETNSHEIQGILLDSGFETGCCMVVKDDPEEIRAAVDCATAGDARFVITTGGLGPTVDDVTREAVARAAGVQLREDPKALAEIEGFFRRLGRPMNESNRRQALVPQGAEVLPNTMGTAPAFIMSMNGTLVFCLPGVPAEMRFLMKESVILRLKETRSGNKAGPMRAKVHIIGLTESAVNDRISEILSAQDPKAGITVQNSVITISLVSEGVEARAKLDMTRKRLRDEFGIRIFSEDTDGGGCLEATVGKLLIDRKITFALAESCTGGLVGHLLTQVPGISSVFREGTVAYSGQAKVRTLEVPVEMIEKHGEVSAEVAGAMALGAAKRAGAMAGLGITGIAGPGGEGPDKPVGLVYMAACIGGHLFAKEYRFTGDRELIKMRSAYLALDLLRRAVLRFE